MSGRGDYSGGRGRGGGGRSGGGRDRGASDGGRGGGRSGGYDGGRGGGYEGGRGCGYGGRGGGGGYVGGRGGGHEGGRGGGGYGGRGGGYEGGRGVGGYGGRGGGYEGGRRGGGGGGRGGGGRGEAWSPPPGLVTLTTDDWAAARQTLEDHLRKLTVTPSKPKNEPPARPGFGKLGLPYRVTTNHLMVHFNVDQGHFHHYDVSIEPDVPSRKLNKDILTKLAITHKKDIGNIKFSYDGKKGLYTTAKLQFDSKDFVVRLTDNGPGRRERLFKVTIKYANAVDCSQLQEFLGGKLLESPQEIIQVYDVVLRSAKRLDDYVLVGRSLFSSALGCAYLADGLNYWQGFYQSLRPTQMGLTLNIDSSARAFYKPAHVIEFLGSLGIRLSNGTLLERERPKVKKALKGVTIEFTHREPRRKYKVIGISDQSAQKLKFSNSVGKQQSISEYFLEKYNISLIYPLLPCLEVGSSKKSVSLPMEVCRIVDGQRYPKKLSEHQVSALLKATAVLPANRACKILEMVAQNDYDEDDLIKNFGLRVDKNFTSVNARVLPPPKLKYKGTNPAAIVEPSVGQWKMFNQKFIEGAYLKYWSIVSLSRNMNNAALTEFRNRLVQEFSKRGMVAELPLIENCVIPEGLEHFKGVLEDVQTKSNTKIRHEFRENCQLQLMVIILPDGYVDYYGHIKQICETELGIVSQCIRSEKALRAANSYIENVVLKINVKAGGRNTVLLDAFNRKIPLVSEEPTIIVGADVTHPQAGEDSSPSIAAVVASMDWPCNVKYRALVGAQPHRKEIINNLSVMVRELLHSFRISNEDALPRRIIFYRDGVSDGEFANVLLHEMIEMMKAFDSFGNDYRPAVTFIVVQKRHHTRLFSEDSNKTDRSGNVLPGTVVDNKICHPYQHDFYLCSHAGIQGTSKPTHYHVLHDENHFSADLLQLFTNSLCYTYARCTRSVSVVPPVYYAHLAAFRARHYVQGESYDTSSPSGGVGMSSRSNVGVVRPLPEIKENVKEVMFFC